MAPSSAIFGPPVRRNTARRRVGTSQDKAEPRMSTTRSHRCGRVAAHSFSQCRLPRRLRSTMVRSRFGMRAKTPSATGPQTTVIRASG